MNIFGKIILSLLITSNVFVFSGRAMEANPEKISESKINKIGILLSRLTQEAPEIFNALKSYFEASFISGVNPEGFVVRDGEDDYLSNRENKAESLLEAQKKRGFLRFLLNQFEKEFGPDDFIY